LGIVKGAMYGYNTDDANAVASGILLGKKGYVARAGVTGTMPNQVGVQPTTTLAYMSGGNLYYRVPLGYFDGSVSAIKATPALLTAADSNFIEANINLNVDVLGRTGTMVPFKVASGTTVSNTDTVTYRSASGVNSAHYPLSVTPGFTPDALFCWKKINSTYGGMFAFTMYISGAQLGPYAGGCIGIYSSGSSNGVGYTLTSVTIGSTCSVPVEFGSTSYSWMAFG